MAVLTDLPVELLVCVFHYLESIDDVHYLGRVCKKTYGIISQRSFYLEIIRTVIQYAPQHRYDYQLCNVLRLHHNVVNDLERHYRTSLGVVPGTVPLYDFTSSWQQSLKSITSSCSDLAAWSDNAVCDVLARYQGIRILEDVWLERELSETDFVTVDGSSDAQQLEDRYFDLCDRNDQFADGELPPRNPQNPHTQSYIKFNSDQRGRFYAALVYVWLLSEIQWVSTQLVQLGSVSMSGLVRSLENCKNSMAKEQASPLLDELDRYAVFTFLYHHLFPLYAEFLADQDSSQLPLTFDSDFNNHGAHWMLQLVLMAGQAYLQPPDLIDLLVREKRGQSEDEDGEVDIGRGPHTLRPGRPWTAMYPTAGAKRKAGEGEAPSLARSRRDSEGQWPRTDPYLARSLRALLRPPWQKDMDCTCRHGRDGEPYLGREARIARQMQVGLPEDMGGKPCSHAQCRQPWKAAWAEKLLSFYIVGQK
ncbi:hypothetical protein CFE70_002080 [Pyrenophora teres f. teres 0-1]